MNNKNTSYTKPKLRKIHEERLTLLMETQLVRYFTGPLVPTQQDSMIIKGIKIFNSSQVIKLKIKDVLENIVGKRFFYLDQKIVSALMSNRERF